VTDVENRLTKGGGVCSSGYRVKHNESEGLVIFNLELASGQDKVATDEQRSAGGGTFNVAEISRLSRCENFTM